MYFGHLFPDYECNVIMFGIFILTVLNIVYFSEFILFYSYSQRLKLISLVQLVRTCLVSCFFRFVVI